MKEPADLAQPPMKAPPTMSNLLALDQSSHTTGYSVFIDGIVNEVNHFDCVGNDLGDRLEQLRNNVLNLINKY